MIITLFSWIFWFVYLFLKLVLWFIGFLLFSLWWCQGQLLYLPTYGNRTGERRKLDFNPPGTVSPADLGLVYEDHFIKTTDGVLVHTWVLPQENRQECPTIIFFHGNAGNIGYRLQNARSLLYQTGSNVVLVEYRGYGNSTGMPSEKGLMLDGQAVLDWLRTNGEVDPTKIFVFGRSLGGAVAMTLAHNNQENVCGLIVENTFLSIDEIVLVLAGRIGIKPIMTYPAPFRWFLFFFLTNHWKSDKLASNTLVPTLFVSGLADELIPPEHMRALHSLSVASNKQCHFFGVEGGTHNDTHMQNAPLYYATVANFVADYK